MFTVEFCKSLFEVLCHSLWQGLALSVVVWGLLCLLPARRSATRYTIACAGLFTLVAAMLCTWSVLNLPSEERVAAAVSPVIVQEVIDFETNAGFADTVPTVGNATQTKSVTESDADWITWAILAWSVGVLVMLIRTIRGYHGVRVWKLEPLQETNGVVEAALHRLRHLSTELSKTMGLRRNVGIRASDRISSPLVVGIWWPVILLPLNMLSGNSLSDEQWRVVVAHELAHVRRYDGLVNLAQILIESFLFFNPFVWWLSRHIRAEREACCDATALQLTGQPITVASTLLDVAATSVRMPQPALAFTAKKDGDEQRPGSLRDRVTRLVQPDQAPGIPLTWLSFVLSLLLLTGTGFALKKGTDVAVQSVAAMLTPQERVDELARVQTLNTGIAVPPASSDGKSPATPNMDVPVKIFVTVADGLPLPTGVSLTLHHKQSGSSSVIGDSCEKPEDGSVFTRDKVLRPGLLVVSASVSERAGGQVAYRPDASKIVRLVPGGSEPLEIRLTLTDAVDSHLQLLDDKQMPLADVPVSVLAWAPTGQGKIAINDVSVRGTTDADGKVAIPNVSDKLSYSLRVQSPGWEMENDVPVEFKAQQVTKFSLTPALPTIIRVVDSVKGRPLQGVSVLQGGVTEIGDNDPGFSGDPRSSRKYSTTVLGETDAQGKLTLTTLNRSHKYRFGYFKNGYQIETKLVIAGKSPGEVQLTPAFTVSGRIDGDLSVLQTRKIENKRQPVLWYYNRFKAGDHYHRSAIFVPVEEDGSFTINNLIPGPLEIRVPGAETKFTVTESRDDLVVPVYSAEDSPMKQTKVTVNFTGLPQGHPIRGTVQGYWHARSEHGQIRKIEIRDGRFSLQAPAGSRVDLRPDGIVGAFVSDDEFEFNVNESGEDQTVDVPVSVAGGIYGQVTRHDGSMADGASISVLCTEESGPHSHELNSAVGTNSATFFRSLPLGNRYVVLAREFNDGTFVWAVSDEFEVSESQPIHRVTLKLNKPEQQIIRVVNSDGQPLINAKVELAISHSMNHHSGGAGVDRRTNNEGIAVFNLAVDSKGGPFEVNNRIIVHPPSGFAGWQGLLQDVGEGGVVTLTDGASASGKIVNADTGEPVVGVPVRVLPAWDSDAIYNHNQSTRTDANGVFKFNSLEPVTYSVYIERSIPDGAVVFENPGGGYRYEYPHGSPQVSRQIVGGAKRDVEFRVRMHDDY